MAEAGIALSICIATYRRAQFIGRTLDSIVDQLQPGVELLVLDGASPDGTAQVLAGYERRCPQLIYRREAANSGFDADYDKAVALARGEFCWLMTDDDLLAPGAVARVLANLAPERDLLVVNAEVRNRDFSARLQERMLAVDRDSDWPPARSAEFFALTARYLSFIGAVVVRRSLWLARERPRYYGSLFIHVGVIFQRPLEREARVLADPLIVIRYGNAQWSARSFEVWNLLWPRLVWSLEQFDEAARRRVVARRPAESLRRLLWFRAIGAFGAAEGAALSAAGASARARRLARLALRLPAGLVNGVLALYCLASLDRYVPLKLFELARAPCASRLARLAGALRGVPRG